MNNLLNDPKCLAICAGISFGVWPFFLARCRLVGTIALLTMACIQLFILFVLSHKNLPEVKQVGWMMLLPAAGISTLGMFCFTRIGEILPANQVGGPYAVAMVLQATVLVLPTLLLHGELNTNRIAGILFGLIGIYLMIKG